MNPCSKRARQVHRIRLALISATAVGSAVVLACLISIFTVPTLAGIPVSQAMTAVAVTTLLVATPVMFALSVLIAKLADQRSELEAREQLLVSAQEIGRLGYWQFDVASGELSLSDNVHVLLGDPERQLRMTLPKLLSMTHPEDRDSLSGSLKRILVDGSSEANEYRITGVDGVEKTFWVDGRRMLDAAGRPVIAHGACQDISDQKAIEAALCESEDHYRHAVELNPQIPWTADPAGNILEAGPLWLSYTGIDLDKALGTGWLAALHPDDLERTISLWDDAQETGAAFDAEYRLRQAEGSYRWFRARASARRNEAGEIVRWYGTLEDIHDHRTAYTALRESEAFAHSILESTPDAVRVLDMDGNVQFINTPGMISLEIDDFEASRGKNWPDMWPESERGKVRQAIEAARAGVTERFSGFRPTTKGTPKWWDVSVSPIPGPEGVPHRLLVVSRDMTEARRAQEELEKAKRSSEEAVQRLENVLSSTTDCVMTLDCDFRITYLNRRAQEVLAEDRNILGMMHSEAFPGLDVNNLERRYKEAFESQEPAQFEEFLAAYETWLNVHVYPSPDGVSIFFEDISERRRAQERLSHLAHYDQLTGLANRTVLERKLDQMLSEASAQRQTAVLFLDLDDFKIANDTFGHAVGDELLLMVSERLKRSVRDSDVVARFGGDEFVLVAEVTDPQAAADLAERIIASVQEPYAFDGRAMSVGASIGVVTISEPGVAPDEAIGDADIALYKAKAAGRGSYRVFDPAMGHEFRERQALKRDLRDAIAREELAVVYQPLMDLRANRVSSLEALLRWTHPERGVISPSVFIPLAEEGDLITKIGEWVLRRACQDAAAWPDDISVAVNLSSVQFISGNLVQMVSQCLTDSGLSGERLHLEITETVLLADNVAHIETLHALRELGVSISMDDFGTGYSSLNYLRSFPFDKIKIDKAFVNDLSAEKGSGEVHAIIGAVVELARNLGVGITAEGVETEFQLSQLRSMGCEEVQGFLFSRPVPREEVPQTIANLSRQGAKLRVCSDGPVISYSVSAYQ